MHSLQRVRTLAFVVFTALACLGASGCTPTPTPTPAPTPAPTPTPPPDLTRRATVHGVVTDAALLTPLKDVQVTLLSGDNLPAVTTDAHGYFQFANVLQVDNVLVQFHAAGYVTQTVSVATFPTSLDANNIDAFDASVALRQELLLPVSGTVYDGVSAAKGAQVLLSLPDGTVGYQATTAADGRFTFAGVRPADWTLQVLPFDRDGDMTSDTQYYTQPLDLRTVSAGTVGNLGNLVVVLSDVTRAVVASSFTSLSAAYPIAAGTLVGGVSGVLPAPGSSLFLHFGAEVDPALTAFELVPVEPGPRYGTPIGLTVTWERATIAHLTAASALAASSDTMVAYELRVRALRFRDGTAAIVRSPTGYGVITFTVQALPTTLASVSPTLYLANQFTRTQTAASAVVDQSTVWLLDANGDFVFDTVPSANFAANSGLLLGWTHLAGAVRYHVLARNTTSSGGSLTATLDWRELVAVAAPDPTINTQVVVTANPWSGGTSGSPLGYGGAPWAFGNHVQFTVLSEDALGFRSVVDGTKVLDTSDTFGGLVTAIEIDPAVGGVFSNTAERGASFLKTVRVSFSEPMNTSTPPTLASTNANLTVKRVVESTWSTNTGTTPTVPLNVAPVAFESLQLAVKGACTEVLVDRVAGDTLISVRDASFFTASSSAVVVLLSLGGAFVGEAVGIASIDSGTNRLTLSTGLVPNALLAGSLACALQAPAVPALTATAGTALTVADASAFYVGEPVLVYEPQVNGAGQIADARTVVGVDTTTKTLLINAATSAGHTSASVVLPLNVLGGEVALRSSTMLALAKDTVGAAGVELFFTGPANVLVGDLLQVDADGDLKTTNDQAVVAIKQVKFAPTGVPATYSLIVDLPALTLLHGKATLRALGDALQVSGTRDSSGNTHLDTHRDQFSPDGVLF